MKRILLAIFLVLITLSCYGQLEEPSPIKITMEAYRVWNASEATATFEPLDTVFPGDEVLFVIFCEKYSTDLAKELSVSALVPENTSYVPKSATGDREETIDFLEMEEAREVELFFSVNGGEDFSKPPLVFDVEMGGITISRVAKPEMYTNIKWVLPKGLEPGEKLVLQYRIRVSK